MLHLCQCHSKLTSFRTLNCQIAALFAAEYFSYHDGLDGLGSLRSPVLSIDNISTLLDLQLSQNLPVITIDVVVPTLGLSDSPS